MSSARVVPAEDVSGRPATLVKSRQVSSLADSRLVGGFDLTQPPVNSDDRHVDYAYILFNERKGFVPVLSGMPTQFASFRVFRVMS